MTILPMSENQSAEVLEIYRQGVASGVATFETTVPSWEEFSQKYLSHSRMVAVEENKVIGFAFLVPYSKRECYKGVAEVSLYVAEDHQRKGVGRSLLLALIEESEKNGIWSLQSIIHDVNRASIHLHEQCGFRYIGYREKIAQLNGEWRSTVLLERRSRTNGL